MEAKQQELCVKEVGKEEMATNSDKTMPVLPREVLCMIFRMCDSETFHTAINLGPEYREPLKRYKPKAFFPLVLPFVVKYLSPKDIFKLRRISSSFRDCVDFLLQYGSLPRETDEMRGSQQLVPLANVPSGLHLYKGTTVRFTKYQEIELFLEQFRGNENPFPGRSIDFEPIQVNVDEESLHKFEDLTKRLLSRFGHHILRLTYTMPVFPIEEYARLNIAYILHHVRNLRLLFLKEGDQWLWPKQEQLEVVQQYNFLPALPKLKILYLPDLLDALQCEIIQWIRAAYHRQVGCIRIHSDGLHFYNDYV